MTDENIIKTKDQLDKSNYKLWRQQIRLLLTRLKLNKYINYQILKKVDGSSITEEQKKSSIPVDDTINIYYSPGTKEEDIVNDAKTKEVLMNSINNDLAMNLDFISSTAYDVFNAIKGINISDDKERIQEIKDSLSKARYQTEEDVPISIFISNMNIKFKELENLKAGLDFQEKFDYLYNSIPEDLVIKSNLISQQEDWEKTTQYLITTLQHLKRLKIKKEKTIQEINAEVNYINQRGNRNNRNNYFNKNKRKTSVKCWNCGKIGHYKEECKFKNNKNNNGDYKNKQRRSKNNGRRMRQ